MLRCVFIINPDDLICDGYRLKVLKTRLKSRLEDITRMIFFNLLKIKLSPKLRVSLSMR